MKYLFESEPLDLAKTLGVKSSEVAVTTYASGAVEVEVPDAIASETTKAKILVELNKRGYPRGSKPK